MSYCAILTYHPEIGTFRNGRGAWRVLMCYPGITRSPSARPYISCGINYAQPGRGRALFMDAPRRLRKGTYVNPAKLLRELNAQQRVHKIAREQVRTIEQDILNSFQPRR